MNEVIAKITIHQTEDEWIVVRRLENGDDVRTRVGSVGALIYELLAHIEGEDCAWKVHPNE